MKTHELIVELGRVLHLPSLALDEYNVCRVIFDTYAIDFEALPDKDELFLIAELGPIPDDLALYRRLLEANRYGIETGGATLSIDPDRDSVIIHRQLDVSSMNYATFELKVQLFFERLKHWKGCYMDSAVENRHRDLQDIAAGQQLLRI